MKKRLYLLLLTGFFVSARAQEYVIDVQHAIAVTENGVVRSSAESAHASYLGKINDNINDLNTNVGSVILAQTMIYNALSNVNSALKNGLEVKNMAVIIADMTGYINQALAMARTDPALLVFAGRMSGEMKSRALALVTDVSGFVLKEGSNVLADYAARDELLRRVTRELQILDGLAYGAWKAMFWAKERGIIASLNPFAAYVSRDRELVGRIISNAKYLKH
ncbi:hypothetical protein LJ707_02130 [Mucilaginibacter sp. UR6-1]|uniref:hypothetical protein n=1 Tax=Mucilaginibacter sp. UR6-1 TaxID=1435643 RepID=UPI001E569D2A|nr:hypothetical protein [Mucilaginibacter sp. UR6-1]MCC8407709.1 hypothetical protein [Mucilaginibacter sp. UR6-1]